ncbi:MAG: hypothetical protein WA584_23395 [Pyrinomonadaceae bacterium]
MSNFTHKVLRPFPAMTPMTVGMLIDASLWANRIVLENTGYIAPLEMEIGVDIGNAEGDSAAFIINGENASAARWIVAAEMSEQSAADDEIEPIVESAAEAPEAKSKASKTKSERAKAPAKPKKK